MRKPPFPHISEGARVSEERTWLLSWREEGSMCELCFLPDVPRLTNQYVQHYKNWDLAFMALGGDKVSYSNFVLTD